MRVVGGWGMLIGWWVTGALWAEEGSESEASFKHS